VASYSCDSRTYEPLLHLSQIWSFSLDIGHLRPYTMVLLKATFNMLKPSNG